MALVDEALKKKQKQNHLESVEFNASPEYDELGLRVQNTTDYVVARILKLNPHLFTTSDRRLVYEGKAPLMQAPSTLYRLSQNRRPIPPHYQQIIWARLLSLLPVMSDNKIEVIKGKIWWDKEKGELVFDDDTRRQI